jgi:hypothetical protein
MGNPTKIEFSGANSAVLKAAFEAGRRERLKKKTDEVRMDLIYQAIGLGVGEQIRQPIEIKESSQDPAGALDDIASGVGSKL